MKMQVLNRLGWIPQIIAHVIPGSGASSFPDSSPQQQHHEAQIKSPRAMLPCSVLQRGDQSLSEAVRSPGWKRAGCCPCLAQAAGAALAGVPGIPLQCTRFPGWQMNYGWVSQNFSMCFRCCPGLIANWAVVFNCCWPNASSTKKYFFKIAVFWQNALWQGMGNPNTCDVSGPHVSNILLNSLACGRNDLVLFACFAPLSLPLAECVDEVN